MGDSRITSQDRANVLKNRIQSYQEHKISIPTGLTRQEKIAESKARILAVLGGNEDDWNSWQWQLKNRIEDVETLEKIIQLSPKRLEEIKAVGASFRWAVSPYYASLMNRTDENCPIQKQAIPAIEELVEGGETDPMGEEFTSPVEGITRRYPDRLIINVTNQCAMYCRHCQRRRNIGLQDSATPQKVLEQCIAYIRENKEIRDVLITGGDALLISFNRLEWLLKQLREIEHVEIIRLGTRTLVTMPQIFTQSLCEMLSKYHPIYLNTHFNHAMEITQEVLAATDRLTRAGIPLGNQAVLLKGINNDAHIMKKLNHELLKARIRPYYIFHPKDVIGTKHFKVRIQEGMEIMENLRGFTSGLAIPTYILNAPLGKGKTPILPNYIVSWGEDYVKIRTWEGEVIDYPN